MSGDILLDGVRRLVKPYGLRCRPISNGMLRVYATRSGAVGAYHLKHDFQRSLHIRASVKRWLSDAYVQEKLATLREMQEAAV